MAHEILISDQLIQVRMSGPIDSAELFQIALAAAQLESSDAGRLNRLIDLSGIDALHLDFAAISTLAARRSQALLKSPVKSAILAPRPVQFGMARMFQSILSHPMIEVQVFQDLPGAMNWLRAEVSR